MYVNVCISNVGPQHLKYLSFRKMFRLIVIKKHTLRFMCVTLSAHVLHFLTHTRAVTSVFNEQQWSAEHTNITEVSYS